MNRSTVALISLAFFFAFASTNTFSQRITDQDLEDIKREKEMAEARKAIAEAEAAELKARFPAGKSTPLEGKTTVSDGTVIETQMMAYAAMARAANEIAAATKGKRATNMTAVAIYGAKEIDSMLSYRVTLAQLDLIRKEYCKVLKHAAAEAASAGTCEAPAAGGPGPMIAVDPLMIANSFLGAFVDLTALLRTNVEIKGQSFDIDEAAFASEVFRAMREKDNNVALYYPAMFPPKLNENTSSALLARLQKVNDLKLIVEKLIADLAENDKAAKKNEGQIKEVEGAIDAATSEKGNIERELTELLKIKHPGSSTVERIAVLRARGVTLAALLAADGDESLPKKLAAAGVKKTAFQQARQTLLTDTLNPPILTNPANIDKTLVKLQTLIQQFDQFIASLIQADKASGVNALTSYIKAEKVDSVLPDATGYWLQIRVIKAGGNNRIKTNLLWDIFTGGNRVSHSGGTIAQYLLFDKSGKIVASDVLTVYRDYIKANKVRGIPSAEIDDK